MGLTTGGDDNGPAFGVSYFDPRTGGYGSDIQFKQQLNMRTRGSDWLPPGLTIRMIKEGNTQGFRRVACADGVPGFVWIPI